MAANIQETMSGPQEGGHAQETVLQPPEGEPELIVVFKSDHQVKLTHHGLEAPNADVTPVQAVLENHEASLKLLFGQDEDRLRMQQSQVLDMAARDAQPSGLTEGIADTASAEEPPEPIMPDMASFYHVDAPAGKLEQLAKDLNELDQVEAAYIVPGGAPPLYIQLNAVPVDAALPTPNFVSHQTYLDAAPGGIDAKYAHTLLGGKGDGVKIIDCEWGWRFTHEDLTVNQGGVVAGSNSTDVSFVNHGTAVCGIISGDVNLYGIVGIVPNSFFRGSSFVGQSVGAAIKAAADRLQKGDVILLEIHAPGPNAPNPPQGQKGYIAIEWWPDALVAIRYAVAKGIVVVEAAGNGAEDLDAAIYDKRPDNFPTWWRNPFRSSISGAVLVGAGCPPPGTHNRNWGPDRSRLDFSNWGSRVDCQGWGREVCSAGYGDLQGGVSPDLWYTDQFSGTSSASPIVTGAVLAAQGVRKARGRRLLTSQEFRGLLRRTGSPQQAGPGAPVNQRIGNRPNLKQLIPAALIVP